MPQSNGNIISFSDAAIHPFVVMRDNTSDVSKISEQEPLVTPPPTIWTKFNKKHRHGRLILVSAGLLGMVLIMFIVLGSLGVFHNTRYRNEAGVSSIGRKQYPGTSSGGWANNDKKGSGDGTYYGKIKRAIKPIYVYLYPQRSWCRLYGLWYLVYSR